jgi:hypothetical protein
MKVLPVHRLQKYFRELEMAEDAKLQAKGITYIGGPEQLSEALLAEEQEPLPGHYTIQYSHDCPDCRRWQMCTAVVLVAMGLVVWVCGR